jgi:hypothetical protein
VCVCAYGRKKKVIFKKKEEDEEDELTLAVSFYSDYLLKKIRNKRTDFM